VSPGDHVLEIGAGTGVLTRALLSAGARVTALERDRVLATALAANNEALVESGALRVVHDDALRWLRGADAAASFPELTAAGAPRAKVVSNIPYAISTELLGLLLPRGAAFGPVVLLVQEEWAQRLVAAPAGAADAREMSMRVRFYAQPRYVRFVPRAAFSPPPNVDSAVVAFDLRQPQDWPLPRGPRTAAFFAMLRAAFASRRKMLRKTLAASALGASGDAIGAALAAAGASPDARPQELALSQFLALFAALQPDEAAPKAV
jgi:16S rRNA A1518/A1519 N6-dimethyltransferase RsmA/KsgA/DIM1 with predicted DNA glycosylase/AP lyase activity